MSDTPLVRRPRAEGAAVKVLVLRLALDGEHIDLIDAAELEREISRSDLGPAFIRHGLLVEWSDARWER